MKKLLIITGQTATGKTNQAITLAKEIEGEIISADSRQIYEKLDIITGKDYSEKNFVLVKELKAGFKIGYYTINQVRVWLYDVLDPKEYFSAHHWQQCCLVALAEIEARQKIGIIVGGSFFYIHNLLYPPQQAGVGPDWDLRKQINLLTKEELQKKLEALNNTVLAKLNNSDRNNRHRLIRWIEKESQKSEQKETPADIDRLSILKNYNVEIKGYRYKNKECLRERIITRVEARLKQGAQEEVELLLRMGYKPTDPGLQTIGYAQLIKYAQDKLSLAEAKEEWINKEMQYAKRQYTFMKKNPDIEWQEKE